MIAVRGFLEAAILSGFQAIAAHQPGDPTTPPSTPCACNSAAMQRLPQMSREAVNPTRIWAKNTISFFTAGWADGCTYCSRFHSHLLHGTPDPPESQSSLQKQP